MHKQCETCIKRDVCEPIYHHGAFEDKPCEHRLAQVPPNEFRFSIGATAWYVRNTENGYMAVESTVNELKINQNNKIRYRVEGCGRDLRYGKDIFQTEYEAFKAVDLLKGGESND